MAGDIFNPKITDERPSYTSGARLFSNDGKAYVYVKASSILSRNHTAMWRRDFEAQLVSTSRSNAVGHAFFAGVPEVTIPSGHYGWCQVYGACRLRVATGYAANGYPYTTTSAGIIDDATGGGATRVRKMIGQEAGGGDVDGFLMDPSGSQLV